MPLAVRIYGEIIEALNFIGMVGGAIGTLLGMYTNEDFLMLIGPVQFFICLILYMLGKGLTSGNRKAVYGMSVLGGLSLIAVIYLCATGWFIRGLVLLSIVSVLYIPPVVIAFRRLECFH